MDVQEVYRHGVIRAAVDDPLADVAGTMCFEEVGALAVFSGDALAGIITERDLVRAMADGANPSETPAEAYMTSTPVTVTPDATVTEALQLMTALGARHLPVVEAGAVVGMVSLRDLVPEVAGPRS